MKTNQERFPGAYIKSRAVIGSDAHVAERVGADFERALDLLEEAGYGETALVCLDFALRLANCGVNQDQWLVFLLRGIDHDKTSMEVHLAGGEANTRCFIHGLEHSVCHFGDPTVDIFYRFGNCSESWVRKFQDF